MPVRAYVLYFSGAAAQAVAQIQILKPCELLNLSFTLYAGVGNGSVCEISQMAARQYATNNTQGILGMAAVSNPAAGTGQLANNAFVPLPPGCKLNTGDLIYMHTTQAGAGGSTQCCAILYVRE